MATTGEHMLERRGRTQRVISKLVNIRQEMLVLYCRVAGLEPYTPDKPLRDLLQNFCEVMVDYAALGHFEFYQRVASGKERRSAVVQLSEQVYSGLVETSRAIVDFNDKYDCDHGLDHDCEDVDELAGDLSALGEQLAIRAELEDRLIGALVQR